MLLLLLLLSRALCDCVIQRPVIIVFVFTNQIDTMPRLPVHPGATARAGWEGRREGKKESSGVGRADECGAERQEDGGATCELRDNVGHIHNPQHPPTPLGFDHLVVFSITNDSDATPQHQ